MLKSKFISLLLGLACSCSAQMLPVNVSPVNGTEAGACMLPTTDIRREEVRSILQDQVTPYLLDSYTSLRTGNCGGLGWIKVAEVNMTEANSVCPTGLNLFTTPIRGCGRNGDDSVGSTYFSVGSHSYTRVCGRVQAIQKGRTNAFNPALQLNYDFNDPYVDGVSLSHGSSTSRTHIWSFASGFSQTVQNVVFEHLCPCRLDNFPLQLPSYIGDNYFCESGSRDIPIRSQIFTSDPLWDGKGCPSTSNCCQFNNPPWFYAELPQPTTDDLEMRVLCSNVALNENVIVTEVEVYIQ